MPSLLRTQNRCRVWGRHSPTRFHEGQIEQMAKFGPMVESCSTLPLLSPAFSFSLIFQVHAFGAESCFEKMTKQKEPITQNIKNRREHRSRFKVMFYVIGSEKSKSGSVSYSSCQQNQRLGGAVRHFRCTDTVSDKSDSHKICLNILIQFLYGETFHDIIIQTATSVVKIGA